MTSTSPAAAGAARLDVDVLVVGSGIAGLTTALEVLRLAPGAHVAVATKGALGDGATAWAQGGIAAVLPDELPHGPGDDLAEGPSDEVALHVADTLAAGDGLCASAAVAVLCGAGAAAVAALQARGLQLDAAPGGRLARGLEAAHSRPRVVHAGGDTTGAHVARALGAAVRASRAALLERTALVALLTPAGPGTAVTGARLRGPGGEEVLVGARAVVLATGGHAQVYAHTTTPAVATGDGLTAAVRAGAVARDVEMVQFHPTAGAGRDGRTFLVSEAVRGEGAVLLDASGHRFTDELAPRDVVARACAAAMAAQAGAPVLLDATGVEGLRARFPGIDALTRAAGLDWTREPVPVTPAAHYAMGGVLTDLDGRTTLPGLWAVGEVASTGVHGANRLASNSLLEGAVFGARAAAALVAGTPAVAAAFRGDPDDERVAVELPAGVLPRAELQELVWEHAGLLRDRGGLELLTKTLCGAVAATGRTDGEDSTVPGGSADLGEGAAPPRRPGVAALEDRALTDVAALLAAGALAREESRGAHARTDHPAKAPRARHVLLRAVLEDQP
ncbi:L-aspartate oxidase [Quadrisphaera sp. INWT6]|uniref:L-aspartate oxidase n=1 Tax=Quadrisphaera sp. INWT6 TaxID=2596917 RepID=UPI00189267BA|nr:FAD-binding protein [Quadrisphaera sp. INWT6]MBF5083571.1 FAD-binding protein [Quadrisphaera sp. INWT6]